jgi:hypothetical protein
MQPNSVLTKQTKLLLFILAALFICGAGYLFYVSSKFHIVSTNPDTGNVASVSPFFKVNFNKRLLDKGYSVTSNPSITETPTVNGKTLTMDLDGPLDTNQTYTITINNISDTSGNVLSSKTFTFTPKNIASQDLPKDQAQRLLKQQAARTPSKTNVAFSGMDGFLDAGLSSTQLNNLEEAIYRYKTTEHTVTVDPNSIQPGPHNPNTSTSFTLNFNIAIDSTPYKAAVVYSDLDSIDLHLFNPQSNVEVYNSGTTSANAD